MDSILRTKDVLNVVGFARTTLWRRVKSGDFPQPVRLGGAGSRAVGWRSGEVGALARGTPECVSRRGNGTLPNRTARSRISSGYFPRRRCSVMARSLRNTR